MTSLSNAVQQKPTNFVAGPLLDMIGLSLLMLNKFTEINFNIIF